MTTFHRIFAALIIAATSAGLTLADDDDKGGNRDRSNGKSGRDVAAVNSDLYAKECGSCHFAYQPGLLPARSWTKIMVSLGKHFGESADLSEPDNAAITEYLTANAAEHSATRRSQKILDSMNSDDAPLRITEVPYIQRKHREVPSSAFKKTGGVKSLSDCKACHTRAETGSYSEHEIKIPGLGNWEGD